MNIVAYLVPAVVVIGWIYLLVLGSKNDRFGKTKDGIAVGIRGWLLFFVLSFMLWEPTTRMLHLYFLSNAISTHPALVELPGWSEYLMWASAGAITALLMIFFAGWSLVGFRQWSSIRKTLIVMWLLPLPTIAVNFMLLKLTSGHGVDFANGIVPSLVTTILWTVYLLRSKRVKATYNKPGFDSEIVAAAQ